MIQIHVNLGMRFMTIMLYCSSCQFGLSYFLNFDFISGYVKMDNVFTRFQYFRSSKELF